MRYVSSSLSRDTSKQVPRLPPRTGLPSYFASPPTAPSVRSRGGKRPRDAPERIGLGDLAAVGEHAQPFASPIFVAGLVPEDRQRPAVVEDVVEAEVVPRSGGTSGIDLDRVVGPGRRPTRPLMTRSQKVEWL